MLTQLAVNLDDWLHFDFGPELKLAKSWVPLSTLSEPSVEVICMQ